MSDTHFALKHVGSKLFMLVAVLGLFVAAARSSRAQTLTTLYAFTGGTYGGNPTAGLVRDAKGNLYGTTVNGGTYGNGTVFEVSAGGKGTVLHSFAGSPDGANPWAGLVRDGKGDLYGATYWGGTYGGGTVFELTKKGTETVLYSFCSLGGCDDGQSSFGGLVRDALGSLYGATNFGGAYGYGTVFEVTPAGNETVLYNFQGSPDGGYPESPLFRDSKGNLYGTTMVGGVSGCDSYGGYGCGTVFEVTPSGTETVLHSFGGPPNDGAGPDTGLVRDAKGNLYGTTTFGGAYNFGTVFKLTKKGAETVLHDFEGGPSDGQGPGAGLIRDKQGNFYGTTSVGGGSGGGYGWGTIFKMAPDGIVTVLYSFTGGADGGYPFGDLVMDEQGNLYGTTVYGGVAGSGCWSSGPGCGTVFKLTP